ncbi:hypothetical protein QQG55_9610 [Brugia pahangi]
MQELGVHFQLDFRCSVRNYCYCVDYRAGSRFILSETKTNNMRKLIFSTSVYIPLVLLLLSNQFLSFSYVEVLKLIDFGSIVSKIYELVPFFFLKF